MTIEQINEMIEYQGVYEIVYKKMEEERTWHISNIELSKEHGDNCISAFCHEVDKDLLFSIKKILSAKRYWIDILDEEEQAPQSGVYLFICRGDNHLITELYRLEQGDKLYKFFEGEYHHMNGWFNVMPLAYHFVDGYNPDRSNSKWAEMTNEHKNLDWGNIRIAVTKTDVPLTMSSIIANGENGFQYYLLDTLDLWSPLDHIYTQFNKQMTLGIYTVISYTEMNHRIHWVLYDQKHPRESSEKLNS
ncbi:MAG: hypothetical protein J6Q22_19035 [Prevotella sp.]|nr:hypothetical protein [Prevotella sp.]